MRWTESLSPLALSLLLELGALVLFGRLAHEVSEGNTLQFDMAIADTSMALAVLGSRKSCASYRTSAILEE